MPLTASAVPRVSHRRPIRSTYIADPHLDKEAVEQIGRRCDTRGTALAVSGNALIVWKQA